MSIRKTNFGKTVDGKKATLYTMTNKNGMEVAITDFGAAVVSIIVPDRDGKMEDVVLGFPSVTGYETSVDNLGGTMGRVCNRVHGCRTVINGKEVILEDNDGGNTLHSGAKSYNKMFFDVEAFGDNEGEDSLEFSRLSPDGEQGWPGNLDVSVTYTLTDDNELLIEYFAVSDKDTAINMTNHSYFNLNGHASGDVLDHVVWLNSEAITPAGPDNVPEGEVMPIDGTLMDFGTERKIGDGVLEYCKKHDFEGCGCAPLVGPHGYDHNYVLATNCADDEVELVATCYSEKTGRKLEVYSDMPGMHFYTGNWVNIDGLGKNNASYGFYQGVCFETQHFPNACNVPSFPNSVYKKGEPYETETIFKFSIE